MVPEQLAELSVANAVLLLVAVYALYSLLPDWRRLPPRMKVLWPALRGQFQLDDWGPVECLRQAAQKHGEIFRISKKDFVEFIENNPGAFIWMRDTLVVE